MPGLSITTFGSPIIKLAEASIAIRRRKALALLVYLAVEGRPFRREELAARFWPDFATAQAYAYLRQAVWELNKALGEGWLLAERETIEINPEAAVWVDSREFSSRLETLHRHPHLQAEICPACIEPLAQAAVLYQADFLHGFSLPDSPQFDEWQFSQAESLRRKFAGVLTGLVKHYQSGLEYEQALVYAHRWVELDPLDEEARRALMRLYAFTDQRAAALRQYQECERILKKELKIAPEPATRELYQQIRAGTLRPPAPAVPAPDARVSAATHVETPAAQVTIPHFATPFIGRQQELAEIHNLLQDDGCRLVSLVGPGGIGKTRLASQAAQAHQTDYPHGVFYLSLVSFSSEDAVILSLLNILGIPPQVAETSDLPSQRQQLSDFLKTKNLLLVLDNCEHLPGLAQVLQEIIAQAPAVKILATSRRRFNLQGEWALEVGGMLYPPELPTPPETLQDYSAVQLFLQSAQRAQVGYQFTAAEIPAVARIARLVSGMPLGLELAAAWVNLLSLDEIAAEIERSLDFLETDQPDVPERQRSLRAVFNYSWNLLSPAEQRLFSQLAVFQGGFTRQAAQEVCEASLRELMSLASKSLIQRSATGRYEMHSLLHYYAAEKLTASPDLSAITRDRYCEFYCSALAEFEKNFKSSFQRQAIQEMHLEIANAHLAWAWALEHRQVQRLDQALEGLILYSWYYDLFDQGLAICQATSQLLAANPQGEEVRLLGRLLAWQPFFIPGDFERHQQLIQLSLEYMAAAGAHTPRQVYDCALAYYCAGLIALEVVDLGTAQAHLQQSLDLLEQLGEKYWKSSVLAALADIARNPPYDDRLAQQYFEQCLTLKREIGDQFGIAMWLFAMGSYAGFGPCDTTRALQYYQEAAAILHSFSDLPAVFMYLECKDNMLVLQGQYQELKALRQEKLEVCRAIGSPIRIGMALAHLGEAHQMVGEYAEGERLGQQAEEMLKDTGLSTYHGFSLWFLGTALLACEKYQEAKELFQGMLRPGLEWNSREFIFGAHFGLGLIAWAQGNTRQAWWFVREALDQVGLLRHCIWCRYPLALAALLLIEAGEIERALELYAAILAHPFVSKSRWFADIFWHRIEPAANSLPPEKAAAARRRGAALDIEAARLAYLNWSDRIITNSDGIV